jgi:excisionase family DNA binding protein
MDELWNVERVAEHLGLSVRTVYQMARDGRIPTVRIGGRWRFRPEDVDAWLADGVRKGRGASAQETLPEPAPLDVVAAAVSLHADPLARRLAFVALLTGACVGRGWNAPVIVGGHAVEFYTAGGYTTVDIDLVTASEPLDEILGAWGFVSRGRHWLREDLGLVVEAPSAGLAAGQRERLTEVRIGDGVAYVLGIEDLIVDRLEACVHWKSDDDCLWAETLLATHRARIDAPYLTQRATEAGVAGRLADLMGVTDGATP